MELLKTIFSATYWMQLDECVSERATGIRLREALRTLSNKSMVVSTLALRFSLCKLSSVAEGDTKKEIMLALGLDKDSKLKTCYADVKDTLSRLHEVDVIFLNKMYVNYTDDVDANFITNSSEAFGVQVDKVGFNYPKYAASFINKWVDTATYKRISDIVDHNDIDRNSSILLLSAAYFKVTWEFPFDIRLTRDMKFHYIDHNIIYIPMMTRTESFMFFDDKNNNLKVVEIKLGLRGSSITIIMPQSMRGLPALLRRFSNEPDLLKRLKQQLRYSYIKVVLPRFKIKTGFDLTGLLHKYSLKQIFNKTNSDLFGMLNHNKTAKQNAWYLSRAKTKNFVILDEMGIFRHIQDVRIPLLPGPQLPKGLSLTEFIADRPFYFTVNLNPSPEVDYELFHGVYYGPE
ncbi:serine protease inhibitor 3/4-like [Epargyreus clarus]|uniref:serine protease inhibitor 3/4-like n=1 Tax=Epargyreus clarus TaxID=520877 RepID=UPI003C2B49A8